MYIIVHIYLHVYVWLRESVREYVSITPEHITSHQQITYNETTMPEIASNF